ncbi:MAG: hypothetical protein J7K68_00665 [Candidatus Diapherotrites archaeon]|nr:hypothetical protein [Candidatus Diapherotrites archaeon]
MLSEHEIGIAAILMTFAYFVAYLFWNLVIKKRRLNRVAEGDRKIYQKNRKKYKKALLNVFSTTPQVVSEAAGVSVATVVLAVTLLMTMQPGTFEYNITSAVLVALAIGSISYLMSMEQLNVALSPSITEGEKFRLYREAIDLKFVGFFMLWGAVLVAMLLTNVYAVLITCALTLIVIRRHYSKRWLRENDEL